MKPTSRLLALGEKLSGSTLVTFKFLNSLVRMPLNMSLLVIRQHNFFLIGKELEHLLKKYNYTWEACWEMVSKGVVFGRSNTPTF
jgi:hypothetical protein